MKATEAKEIAFKAIDAEKKNILVKVAFAAKNGGLSTEIERCSDACKKSLEEDGYKLKFVVEPHKLSELNQPVPYRIYWDGGK